MRCCLRGDLILLPECLLHLRRAGEKRVHQFRIKQIAGSNVIFNDPAHACFIKQIVQNVFQYNVGKVAGDVFIGVFPHQIQKQVGRIDSFTFRRQSGVDSVLH